MCVLNLHFFQIMKMEPSIFSYFIEINVLSNGRKINSNPLVRNLESIRTATEPLEGKFVRSHHG